MSKLLTLLIALFVAAAGVPHGANAAPVSGGETVASEWKETAASRRGATLRTASERPQLHEGEQRPAARQSATYTSPVNIARNRFNAVGPNWKAATPGDSIVEVSVRTSADGKTWKAWQLVDENHGDDDRDRDGRTFGSLVVGDVARYAQYKVKTFPSSRGEWPRVSDVTLTYIDSTAGPTAQQAQARAQAAPTARVGTAAVTAPSIISRAAWGANESYRYANGNEKWGRQYLQVTKAVLHDTVTRNNDPNPAATVRSIYYYHAVTRGWGDIGYNYLIDEQGRIYEGRAGGKNVVAGHALCYNFGTVGVAALGWHGPATGGTPAGVYPSSAMVRAFERVIAWQFSMHGIDPLSRGIFMKRNTEPTADVPNILAHIDTTRSSFPCNNTHVDPGAYLYNQFPAIRRNVAALMGYTPRPAPKVQSVAFWPTNMYVGNNLRVDVTLNNAGTGLMETQAPNPYTVYGESQDFAGRGYDKVWGKYRVTVDRTENPTGVPSPYRFGLGTPLLAGETRTVTGYVTLSRPGSSSWSAGLNKEGVATVASRLGATTVTVNQPGPVPLVNSISRTPAIISPNGDGVQDSSLMSATFSEAVSWVLEIRARDGAVVRRYSGSGASASARWDGKNAAGQPQPNAWYEYRLTYANSTGNAGTPKYGAVGIDTAKPQLTNTATSGYGPYTVSFDLNEAASVRASVLNASGKEVATFQPRSRTAGRSSLSWSAVMSDGNYAPEGTYYWKLYSTDPAGNNAVTYPVSVPFKTLPLRSIRDNGGSYFTSSSAWGVGNYAVPYGKDYRYRRADGSAADPATFKALLSGGTYDVYAWYTSGTNRTTAARYNISTSTGVKAVVVNQQTGGGVWKLLGRVTVKSAENSVKLDAAAGAPGVLIADAIMWDRR